MLPYCRAGSRVRYPSVIPVLLFCIQRFMAFGDQNVPLALYTIVNYFVHRSSQLSMRVDAKINEKNE
jgi:hypothetical protein